MTSVDVDAIRVLTVVVEAGSMKAAAARLGMTPQAVSARMRTLEARLGTELLLRSPSGAEPTEAGRVIAAWAHELLDATAVFAERVETLTSRPQARLRVAASLTVAEHLAPQWIVELAKVRPDSPVDLSVGNSTTVVEDLRAGRIDIGFVESIDLPGDLRSELVARDELVVVVAPDHPWTSRWIGLDDLAGTPLVTREAGSGTRSSFERIAAELGMRLRPPARESSTSAAVRAAVVAGVGPSVLSTLAVRDDLALGRLARVPVEGFRFVRPITALWSGSVAPTGAAGALLDVAKRTRVV